MLYTLLQNQRRNNHQTSNNNIQIKPMREIRSKSFALDPKSRLVQQLKSKN